jgi:hypothetical protein
MSLPGRPRALTIGLTPHAAAHDDGKEARDVHPLSGASEGSQLAERPVAPLPRRGKMR